jgi:hypothetical protein
MFWDMALFKDEQQRRVEKQGKDLKITIFSQAVGFSLR